MVKNPLCGLDVNSDDYSFIRYLEAKKTVDDRALNAHLWQTLANELATRTAEHSLRVHHIVTYLVLLLVGTPLPFGDVLALIVLPSVFLNFLLARPLALWVYLVQDMI